MSYATWVAAHDKLVSALQVDESVDILTNNGTGFDTHPSRAHIAQHKESDLIAGGDIQLGDVKLIISATHWPAGVSKLSTRDRIKFNGQSYSIIHFDANTRRVQGRTIAYEVTIRG